MQKIIACTLYISLLAFFPMAFSKQTEGNMNENKKLQWMQLPPTPTLPKAEQSGYAAINDVRIWYAIFGQGDPLLLLHGGLANSNYWGWQVPVLSKKYRVIVMDSRGHGRSTRNSEEYSYQLMASDVIALLDFLKIKKTAIVGWSDGANIGLDLAIHHPDRISKLFSFAANSSPEAVKDISKSSVFNAYIARAQKEYEELSPTPKEFSVFCDQIGKMWQTQPHFTKDQLNSISVVTWVVSRDHDEAVKREDTEFMAAQIPNAGLLIQPWVSHFSFLQDPEQFNRNVLHFLQENP